MNSTVTKSSFFSFRDGSIGGLNKEKLRAHRDLLHSRSASHSERKAPYEERETE